MGKNIACAKISIRQAIKTFKPAQNNNKRSENKLSADIAKKHQKNTNDCAKKTHKKNNTSTEKSSASVNTAGGKHNICTSTNPVTKTHK